MSILIKGIDLPEVYGSAILAVYECIDGRAIRKEYKLSATQMQTVPPHGRLVDSEALKDALAVLLERNKNLIDEWLAYAIEDVIDEQSTIIEAEEPGPDA